VANPEEYPDITPEDEAGGIDWIMRQRRSAQAGALTSLDANPDDATRAMDLGDSTGTPPAVVYGDLENFEKQHKAALTSELLNNNLYLRDYVNSHPLAAKVSNDDWGQLDAVSQKLGPFLQGTKSVLETGFEGAKEGFEEDQLKEGVDQITSNPTMNRLLYETLRNTPFGQSFEMQRIANAGLTAAAASAGQMMTNLTGSKAQGEKFMRDMMIFPQVAIPELAEFGAVPHELNALAKQAQKTATKIEPWVKAGQALPVGVDPLIDQAHAEQAKIDVKALDEAFKEATKSATRERSPELFSNFVRQHTDGSIGISAEAVRKLYGDKIPAPDDNLLGWAPRIQEQLELAEASGGDVEVPLADWLAKADPEVAKALHDDIRVRPGGMTLEEAKEGGKPVELKEPEITLEKSDWKGTSQGPNEHALSIIHEGNVIGELQVTERNGSKELHVDWMGSQDGRGSLGPSVIREVRTQLSQQFPNAERITAYRDTGGRRAAGKQDTYISIPTLEEVKEGGKPVARGDIIQRPPAIESVRGAAKLDPLFAPPVGEGGRGESGIMPISAKPYEGKGYNVKGEIYQPYLNFPLKDAIAQINPKGLTGISAVMHEFYGDRLSKLVGDTPVRIVKDADMQKISERTFGKQPGTSYTPALYNPNTHEILISERIATGRLGHQIGSETVIHEGAHAMTSRAMHLYPSLANKVKLMMGEFEDALKRDEPDLLKDAEHAYATTNEHEFWAQAWSIDRIRHTMSMIPMSPELAKAIGLRTPEGKSIFDAFRRIIKMMMEKMFPGMQVPDTMVDGLFHLQQEFERVTSLPEFKQATDAMTARGTAPKEGEVFDKAAAIGMTKDQYARYQALISKRAAEDAEHQARQGEKLERERQTQEWKENFASTRKEVEADLRQRPDLAADRFLREGEIHGEKVKKVRLAREEVEPDARSQLPSDYLSDRGVSPDDLAGLFGYQSGRAMVGQLGRLHAERELEGLTPQAHFSKLVDAETERQMRKRFGDLEANILAEAKDHVISSTQLDLLHEETLASATLAKASFPFSKDDLKAWAKDKFNGTPLGAHSTDKYLASAGRGGAEAEKALLENRPADAFKAKQQQYLSLLLANEAKKLEKEKARFETKVKSWQKREPPGVEQEDAIWIHQILLQIGQPLRRSVQDLDRQKELVSTYKNLRDYTEGTNKGHGNFNTDPDAMPPAQQLNVADFLFSDNWRKTVDEMTPEEFRDVFNSLKSIDHYSRESRKITVKGNKEDLNEVVSGLVARLKAAVDNKPITQGVQQSKSPGRLIGSWLLNPETWFNRLDLGNRLGPFNQLIIRPITEGQYMLRTYEREFAKQWKEAVDFKDFHKKIDNYLFKDPEGGEPLQMKKENAYAVLQNMGNELQRKKLVLGWKVHEDVEQGTQQIWNWLVAQGMTKDDVVRAQKIGDVFNKAFELSEKAYTHVAGVAPARIELKTMQTPWGPMKEYYHPLIPDPLRHSSKLSADDMMGESGYFRPSPASGYTKTRTGANYPIDLSFDSVPFKLKQILNDAAMRIPITEVGKVVYHNDFKTAFKKFYGQEYAGALDAWMKDAAGNRQWVPSNLKALDRVVTGLQQNLSTLLIGWNLGTVAKHAPTAAVFSAAEVGLKRFADSARLMMYELPGSREAWKFSVDNSEELKNRMRSLEDTLIGQNREAFKKPGFAGKLSTFRDAVQWYGHAPVGFTDLISAVSMWHAEYSRLSEEMPDLSHGDKVYAADTAVRRTHGSSILSNRPGIMRYNSPFARLIMPFYNFMSNALQRNYELGWKAKLATQGRELPEMTGFEKEQFEAGPQHIKSLIGGVMVYGVMVSLIEQMVDPLPDTKKENRALHWAKILTRGYPSMIPGVRDAVNYLYQGHDPSLGLYGTMARNIDEGIDPKSYTRNPGQVFKTVNNLFGTLTGLTFSPIGKAGEFAFNVAAGKEHPKGFGDWGKGLYHGTIQERKR